MEITETTYVKNREEWREWLQKNYDTKSETWLLFYKKHTGKPSISYGHSVEEALCFGWIDSIIKKIDEDKYVRKFTPRKNTSNWSNLNKKRMLKMIKAGRMTEIGLSKIDPSELDEEKIMKEEKLKKELKIPEFIEKAFKENEKVWENFNKLAYSHKRNFVNWISSAKREATRNKRIKEALNMLEKNKKPGIN